MPSRAQLVNGKGVVSCAWGLVTLIAKTYWGGAPFLFRRPPTDAELESRHLRTQDFRQIRVGYWTPRGRRPSIAVVAMHPRVDFTHHYAIPRFVGAGFAFCGATSRALGDDSAIHEDLLLDLAATIRWLRERRGAKRIVLLGNSGGGSLAAFYLAQAALARDERLAETPAGDPTKLPGAVLPPADALLLVAAHRGQGKVVERAIDPAAVDEADALQTDDALDMYRLANGFAEAPTWSRYAPDFAERYREAQRVRVARIDEMARELVSARQEAAAKVGAPDFASLPADEQRRLARRGAFEPVLTIYRTMANLDYVDRTLDPSPRAYGSLISHRPDLMNWQRLGFARTCTPEAWLSTWSGASSRANIVANAPKVSVPTLMVHAERDREIYPAADVAPMREAFAGHPSFTFEAMDARHYFEPEDPTAKDAPDVEALMDLLIEWTRERVGG